MSTGKSIQLKPATSKPVECLRLIKGLFSKTRVSVVIEKELPIYLNSRHLATASITPGMEREFVTGYLFGQGFINNMNAIESINVDDNGAQVVITNIGSKPDRTEKTSYRIVSGGGKAAYFRDTGYPPIKTDLKINKKAVFNAMNTLFEKSEIYEGTEGVHSAGLFTADAAPVCIVEDIGRHNCLDKLTGYTLINNIDCSHTFLVSTGRMSSEMVLKICRAGIPIAATKTAVTDKGMEIARACAITVIGFVRDSGTRINTNMETRTITEAGMKVYTNARRIENG
jgi:FdhD protein